jgi:nucleotide-binding universal stress UspA family protein
MREILFATDGSEDAGRACRLLAALPRPEGGRVTVVTAIPPAAALWVGRIPPEEWLSAAAQAQEDEAVRRMAQEAAARLRSGGWETQVQVRVGPPAQEILEAAREIGAELIVTGSKGLTGIPAFLIGSVSHNVAKHAECPVLVVRAPKESVTRAIVAVDGSDASERAVDCLLALPLPEGVAWTVVHILEPLSMQWDTFLTEADISSLRGRVEQGRIAAAEHLVERVAAKLRASGRTAEPLVVHGHPAQQLLEVVKERAPDLLVVGARGLNAVEAFLLGSVSGRLLRYAPCSVLVAR